MGGGVKKKEKRDTKQTRGPYQYRLSEGNKLEGKGDE
jgi:hypothetical protein